MMPGKREAWEPVVAAMLSTPSLNRRDALGNLKLLADLLRNDALPESGRRWLADKIEAIALGADPQTLLPRVRKRSAATPIAVLVAYEKERAKKSAGYGEKGPLYAKVGKNFGIGSKTAEVLASNGRRHLRERMQHNIDAGADAEKVIRATADLLKLPVETVRNLFIQTSFVK